MAEPMSDLEAALGSALLEALPYPVLALDAEGAVRFSNSAALDLLRLGDGLNLESGRLLCWRKEAQARLAGALQSHVQTYSEPERLVTVVARPSGRQPWLLASWAIQPPARSGATSLLCILDLAESALVPPPLLQALFGLSQAEARLAALLGAGYDLLGASTRLRIQPETARSQLKAVFRKMGVARQQELVRVLTQIGGLLRRKGEERSELVVDR